MKILLTGANGNLGKVVAANLKKYSITVIESSSKPKNGQRFFDLNLKNFTGLLDEIDVVVHCSRGIEQDHLSNDLKFVEYCFNKNVNLIYIGSASSWLESPNKYGIYKKQVENLVLNLGGVVISCGLIYGDRYKGQIYKLSYMLRNLPVKVQIKNSNQQYLTPLNALVSEIYRQINAPEKFKRIFLVHAWRISFNNLLLSLGSRSPLKIQLGKAVVESLVSLPLFKSNYFGIDSLSGIYGNYSSDLQTQSIDKSKFVDTTFPCLFIKSKYFD